MTKLFKLYYLFSFALFSISSFALDLTVEIKKIKKYEAKIMLELFLLNDQKKQNWQSVQSIQKHVVVLTAENPKIKFSRLNKGMYAVRLFQDLNNNGLLDKSSSNIPLEPVGFSTNPSLFKGEPSPEDSVIELINDRSISIILKQRKSKRKKRR